MVVLLLVQYIILKRFEPKQVLKFQNLFDFAFIYNITTKTKMGTEISEQYIESI